MHEQRPNNIIPIDELRRRKRVRKLRQFLLFLILVLAVAGYFLGVYSQAFGLAADIWEAGRIAFAPAEGWPAKTGVSDLLRAEPFAEGALLLGQKDVTVYSAGGNKLRSIQHGYARPAISAGNTRFCLYNRSGYELRVESRTRSLNTQTFTQPLLLAQMSPNGSVAAVTSSTRAMAELTVYDASMNFRYSWTATDAEGMPSRIAFAPDNKRLAVACLTVGGGNLESQIFLLDIRKDAIVTKISAGAQVLQLHWLSSQTLLAVFDTRAAVYDTSTGKELATYSYGGESLISASVSGQNTALLFRSALPDSPAHLVILDPAMQQLADAMAPAPAKGMVCTRTAAYVLRDNSVVAYTLAGELSGETALEAPPQAVLAAKQLLVFSGGNLQLLEFETIKP